MERLGLRTTGFGRDWTDLGTVTVSEAETENPYDSPTGPKPATTVKVEVSALPAQFWRFTVERPRDETEDVAGGGFRAIYEPMERFVITTGSGGFTNYWPIAKAVAEHLVNIERVE